MISPFRIRIFACALTLIVSCAFGEVRVENSAPNGITALEDTVAFTISGMANLPEKVRGVCLTNMARVQPIQITREDADACTFQIKPNAPGVLTVAVDVGAGIPVDLNGAAFGSVAVSPERVRAVAPPADDLRAYWERVRTQIDYLVDNPRLKLVYDGHVENRLNAPIAFDETVNTRALPDGIEIYAFSVDAGQSDAALRSPAGIRAVGYMVKPVGLGPFPVVITYHAAGVIHAPLEESILLAKLGAMAFTMNPHPVDNATPKQARMNLFKNELKDYRLLGADGARESVYFNGMYQRAYQVVQAVKQSPMWDKKHLAVRGFSQGGAQAIMAAYWCPEVGAVSLQCPAMCDLAGSLENRAPTWPYWFVGKTRDSKAFENARTFDLVNLAPYINARLLIGAGAIDRLCPATGQMAFYNAYKGPKEWLLRPNRGHGLDGEWVERELGFLVDYLGLKRPVAPSQPAAATTAK